MPPLKFRKSCLRTPFVAGSLPSFCRSAHTSAAAYSSCFWAEASAFAVTPRISAVSFAL